ncbi:arsenate-mycothiol transferase ArsC [Runella slithyformis]|uniref:Protein tyrosine phosphatase n=1 Tax=Runella slithyformis (strain ATCC 29530 / DSM 19594 / LMG 11500 / NCIMB 11436 / LSU 4) TaxID=761193 RepID=A0A7U4E6S4_RUNSL|nr:arsenate reductase [Runella slithyformis]AEI49901.1 protein tyrosine phosphatase [Runella slithyformis DSM 19594]
MIAAVKHYFEALNSHEVPAERQAVLQPLATYIKSKTAARQPINLTFICTHNSRRSHLGQVWAQVAAAYFGVENVHCFSGGTEGTACNPRTIGALERAGLAVTKNTDSENPIYKIRFNDSSQPIIAFSKVYDRAPNPNRNFAAIMTCDHAEANCPFIPGAEKRLPIMYIDPKVSDDTPEETATYDARCRQIATEMKWVFQNAKLFL